MTYVAPFRGILYNQDTVNIDAVVAPPYDVISEAHQDALYQRHDNNVIRLILGKETDADTPDNNKHTRSASFFRNWLSQSVLKQDDAPALYLTSVEFPVDNGQTAVRFGLIAQVGLEPFENGNILPHEQTFSGVKSERLGLLKLSKINDSQIFSIFSDQMGIFESLQQAIMDKAPEIDLTDDAGERHQLWRITDPAITGSIAEKMKDSKLFIADGHHRYETALNYKNHLAKTDPSFSDTHPANNIMMYLCSMEDPGLIIFPTHRLLTRLDPAKLAAFTDVAADYFDLETFGLDEAVSDASVRELCDTLKVNGEANKIGMVTKGNRQVTIMTLKNGVMDKKFPEIPASLRKLDVTVLTSLILIDLLGVSREALNDKTLIQFTDSGKEAVNCAVQGQCEISFILNATKIEQVKEVAESGHTMPRKSTYFYPKALTGLVMNKLY